MQELPWPLWDSSQLRRWPFGQSLQRATVDGTQGYFPRGNAKSSAVTVLTNPCWSELVPLKPLLCFCIAQSYAEYRARGTTSWKHHTAQCYSYNFSGKIPDIVSDLSNELTSWHWSISILLHICAPFQICQFIYNQLIEEYWLIFYESVSRCACKYCVGMEGSKKSWNLFIL